MAVVLVSGLGFPIYPADGATIGSFENPIRFTKPGGLQVGDVLIAVLAGSGAPTEAGWTLRDSAENVLFGGYVLERVVDGSEPAEITFTMPTIEGRNGWASGRLYAFRNVSEVAYDVGRYCDRFDYARSDAPVTYWPDGTMYLSLHVVHGYPGSGLYSIENWTALSGLSKSSHEIRGDPSVPVPVNAGVMSATRYAQAGSLNPSVYGWTQYPQDDQVYGAVFLIALRASLIDGEATSSGSGSTTVEAINSVTGEATLSGVGSLTVEGELASLFELLGEATVTVESQMDFVASATIQGAAYVFGYPRLARGDAPGGPFPPRVEESFPEVTPPLLEQLRLTHPEDAEEILRYVQDLRTSMDEYLTQLAVSVNAQGPLRVSEGIAYTYDDERELWLSVQRDVFWFSKAGANGGPYPLLVQNGIDDGYLVTRRAAVLALWASWSAGSGTCQLTVTVNGSGVVAKDLDEASGRFRETLESAIELDGLSTLGAGIAGLGTLTDVVCGLEVAWRGRFED